MTDRSICDLNVTGKCFKCDSHVCDGCTVDGLCKSCSIQCNKCGKYGSALIDEEHRSSGIGKCTKCGDTFCAEACLSYDENNSNGLCESCV